MGGTESKQGTESKRDNSNANSINVIIDKIDEHGSGLSIFLIIIVTILIFHFFIKLYKMNKSCIQKTERIKSSVAP